MLEEINFLEDYIKDFDYDYYIKSEEKRRTVAMTLINIGELVRHLTKDFRKEHHDVPFSDVLGLRDVAAHGYKALRFDFIWNLLQSDIPDLKSKIKEILKKTKDK